MYSFSFSDFNNSTVSGAKIAGPETITAIQSFPQLNAMASTSLPGDYGIIDAARCGDIEMLKEKREEIGDEGMFRRMCDSESDFHGFKVLHIAAETGGFDTCRWLVEEVGVDIDAISNRGYNPLLVAVDRRHSNIAKYLIEQGAEITMTNAAGFTALHYTARREDTEIMTLLLTNGADIEADSVGGTPLHLAAIFGIAGSVQFLLENRAKPNSFSVYLGCSPLVSAIYSGTFDCVKLLLDAEADPNMCANGLSPLAHAIDAKSNNCIRSLLEAGADVDEVGLCGLRPIEYAALVNNQEAIWMLIEARPRILATPNWSFSDLMNRINSDEAKQRVCLYCRRMVQNGDDAWDKQDYSSAIASYTEVRQHYSNEEKLAANRSLCWARMGEGVFALHDAQDCVKMKPDWAKAHLREGIAWHLLKRYRLSSDAFKKAYEMDPKNEDIDR